MRRNESVDLRVVAAGIVLRQAAAGAHAAGVRPAGRREAPAGADAGIRNRVRTQGGAALALPANPRHKAPGSGALA
jgi:hypothetical protein